jgi:hypothetical protein
MSTKTDRDVQRRLVDLSVWALSAIVFGGSFLLASRVDRGRARHVSLEPSASPELAVATPPVPGLRPAPRIARRVVVVRRTRPS